MYQNLQPLSDIQYLEEFLHSFYIQFSGERAAVKDCQSVYIAATPEYAQLYGIEDNTELINKSDNHLKPLTSKYIDNYYYQDRLVESTREAMVCLGIHEYAHGFDAFLFFKKPIINPATNAILGTSLRAIRPQIITPLTLSLDMQNIIPAEDKLYTIGNFIDKEIKLSARQHLVLFLTIYNYSQGEISKLFTLFNDKMTETTVKATLKVLRQKFNVENKEQLIGEATKAGIHILIPEKLCRQGSFILNGFELKIKKWLT